MYRFLTLAPHETVFQKRTVAIVSLSIAAVERSRMSRSRRLILTLRASRSRLSDKPHYVEHLPLAFSVVLRTSIFGALLCILTEFYFFLSFQIPH